MARRYILTPARRAALRKAQAASARKRRGSGKGKARKPLSRKKKVAIGAALVGGAAIAAVGAREYKGTKTHRRRAAASRMRKRKSATFPKGRSRKHASRTAKAGYKNMPRTTFKSRSKRRKGIRKGKAYNRNQNRIAERHLSGKGPTRRQKRRGARQRKARSKK